MTRDTDMSSGMTANADKAAALEGFIAYWQQMRRGADVPRRSDIDPRGIEALLPNAFIAERIAPGLARLRIAGSHLTDLMGMEVRGMPVSAFFAPDGRDALAHHLVRVFDQPAMMRLALSSPGRPAAPGLTGEMVMLPLRSDLGDISRALGCLVTAGDLGRGPRRFQITQADITALEETPMIGAAPHLVPTTGRDTEADRPPAPHRGKRPYLRLVKG